MQSSSIYLFIFSDHRLITQASDAPQTRLLRQNASGSLFYHFKNKRNPPNKAKWGKGNELIQEEEKKTGSDTNKSGRFKSKASSGRKDLLKLDIYSYTIIIWIIIKVKYLLTFSVIQNTSFKSVSIRQNFWRARRFDLHLFGN